MASSKIDMSLDQIIKMGRKQGANSGQQRGGGRPRNRGGRRNNNSGSGPFRSSQQRAIGYQQQQQQYQQQDSRNFQNPRNSRRRNRRRGGPNQQAPQNQRQQIASVVQRPLSNASASGVRYNMKTGRVRRRRARNRDGPRGIEGQHQGRAESKQPMLVERDSALRGGRPRPRARGAQRGQQAYSGQSGSGSVGATGTMRERAALVRRLLERARKRESQTHARQTAVMQRRGLSGKPAAAVKHQSTVRAARKRVAAATRRSQFSAALRRGAPPRSNLKVSVAVDSSSTRSKEPRRSQLVRKYRAEARKLIDAVKNSLHQGGQLTVSN